MSDRVPRALASVAIIASLGVLGALSARTSHAGPGYFVAYQPLSNFWKTHNGRDTFVPLSLAQVAHVRIGPDQAIALARHSLTGTTTRATKLTVSLGSYSEYGSYPPVTRVPSYVVSFTHVWQKASSVGLMPAGYYSVLVVLNARTGTNRIIAEIGTPARRTGV